MENIGQTFLDALKAKGFSAEIDEDGDIVLEDGGMAAAVYFLDSPFEDGAADGVLCSIEWTSGAFKAGQRARMLPRANALNLDLDMVKTCLNDTDGGRAFFVSCSIEVCADMEPLIRRLPLYLALLKEAASEVARWQSGQACRTS